MACSKCGQKGHNARNCPNGDKDHSVVITGWGFTQEQARRFENEAQKAKNRIAPSAQITKVTGPTGTLPNKINQLTQRLAGLLPSSKGRNDGE